MLNKKAKKPRIGFIGQGFIGKNYADDFERRGYQVVRYSMEEPHVKNGGKISDCDIVFIAVPTPTTPKGFSADIVKKVVKLVGREKIAVIKSTIVPGTTKKIQKENPKITVLYSPEFLSEATASYDASHPFSNIVGVSKKGKLQENAAKLVHSVLPKADFTLTCDSSEAEIIKYGHNVSGYMQILTFNILYDLAKALGGDWKNIGKAFKADAMIPNRYSDPVHKNGRGAGGNCFIKDFAAISSLYKEIVKDSKGLALIKAAEDKNINLLVSSRKDLALVEGVYGKKVLKKSR